MDKYMIVIFVVSFFIGCLNFIENVIYKNTEGVKKFTFLNKIIFLLIGLAKIFIALKVSTLFIPESMLTQMEIDYTDNSLLSMLSEEVAQYEEYLFISFFGAVLGDIVAIWRIKE